MSAITQIIRSVISVGPGFNLSGNLLTNPIDGTILIDTGELSGGSYYFGFIITSSVAAVVDIQHRDTANANNITLNRIRLASAGTDYPLFPNKISIDQHERIRLALFGGITGEIQGSIFYIQVD